MVFAPRKLNPAIFSGSAYSVSRPAQPLQQRLRGFFTDARYARNVIRGSPIRARKSIHELSAARRTYVTTSSGPRMVLVMVLISVILGVTSCAISLSPVLISTGRPAFSASRAKSTDNVVGFYARNRQQWQSHRFDHRVQRFDLCTQIVRHWRAM